MRTFSGLLSALKRMPRVFYFTLHYFIVGVGEAISYILPKVRSMYLSNSRDNRDSCILLSHLYFGMLRIVSCHRVFLPSAVEFCAFNEGVSL